MTIACASVETCTKARSNKKQSDFLSRVTLGFVISLSSAVRLSAFALLGFSALCLRLLALYRRRRKSGQGRDRQLRAQGVKFHGALQVALCGLPITCIQCNF